MVLALVLLLAALVFCGVGLFAEGLKLLLIVAAVLLVLAVVAGVQNRRHTR